MATNTLPEVTDSDRFDHEAPQADPWGRGLRSILSPLASLKITVVSFALAIFLILAGTLAQIDHDIWQVMGEYFRTSIAWIPLQIFLPRSMQVSGGFPFPGGFLIGSIMLVNLLAAHALRFKVQARGARLWGGLAVVGLGVLIGWAVVNGGSDKEAIAGESFSAWAFLSGPSMRILFQLIKASTVALVLLAGCTLLFRKRAGVVLLHAGVGLMMLNELVVYSLHSEGQMQIHEGETVNYVQDIRSLELAVVDRSNADYDDVVVVPQSVLRGGQGPGLRNTLGHFGGFGEWIASLVMSEPQSVIRDDKLPFDVELVRFLQNANLRQIKADEANLADAGQGRNFTVDEARASSGTDMGGGVDMSAAYVKFIDKKSGDSLGTHLLSLYPMFDNEQVQVGDKNYNVTLRFKRDYKPYALHLVDVRFDKYMGTNTARNYSSDVRLIDPSRKVDRHVKIWMNNPLRYAGETFYQSNFHVDPVSRKEVTGLQVVANTGWMIPYVGCMIVVFGMLAQFEVSLLRFIGRQSAPARGKSAHVAERERSSAAEATGRARRWLAPAAVLALGLFWFGGFVSPHRAPPEAMQLDRFGRLPLVYEGRLKPFDTLARNSLRVISDREYFYTGETGGKKQPAVKWLLDVIANAPKLEDYPVVRIYNPEVREIFGLEKREGYRYAIKELRKNLTEFEKQVDLAEQAPARDQNIFQKKVLELNHRLRLFLVLRAAFEEPRMGKENPGQDLMKTAQRVHEMKSRIALPLCIPPAESDEEWQPYTLGILRALAMALTEQEPEPEAVEFRSMLVAYASDDATDFNEHLGKYEELLKRREAEQPRATSAPGGAAPLDQRKMDFEAFFNRCQPFFACQWSYCVAFVLAALAWLAFNRPFNRAALAIILLTLAVHTFALVARVYISGRPPVTNLYSSAVFIGWGAVVLGIFLEFIFGLGIGNVIASVAGFSTLVIADRLAGDGDTFTVLQAVLDTQFWLATHVVCITFGYATTYVAGLLGLVYILLGVFTGELNGRLRRDLTRMIYGVLCFAIFFSFWGTVLGGLWADDSWGRFWGWDPKENGALIIVLWNALVLHARWDGMVKDRGLAVLAVAGNIAVSWSWFGVNQLGAGLHSYGFTEGVALALAIFVVSQLAVIGVGSLPKRLWLSYHAEMA
ncbi:MAG TPA: cytochrome c biogenesis protein CcsA [Pirellulales bacterium]|nr:cytochrome c biogenesis protein CcsA [Pirellulales bacterium]